MSWQDVRHHYEEQDDDEPTIPTPIADKIESILDEEWAPRELSDKIRKLVAEWETGNEHQTLLAEEEDERYESEKRQIAEADYPSPLPHEFTPEEIEEDRLNREADRNRPANPDELFSGNDIPW